MWKVVGVSCKSFFFLCFFGYLIYNIHFLTFSLYPWGRENTGLVTWFSRLGALRNAYPALQSGTLSWLYTAGPLLIFAREVDGERLVTAVNASGDPQTVTLSWELPSPTDLLSGEALSVSDGVLRLELPPWGCRLLR